MLANDQGTHHAGFFLCACACACGCGCVYVDLCIHVCVFVFVSGFFFCRVLFLVVVASVHGHLPATIRFPRLVSVQLVARQGWEKAEV